MTAQHADVTGNQLLAARARQLADRAHRGSLDRRAALAAHVALAETRTVPAARVVLHLLDDMPKIRDAALAVLDQLAADVPASQGGAPQEGTT